MDDTVASRFEAALDAIRSLLAERGVRLAYVFGSAARSTERAESDLDVAVLLDRDIPSSDYGRIRVELTTELVGLTHTNDVDVVILQEAPPLLTYNVIVRGRLFLGSELERVRFETEAIKRYIDTAPLRERAARAMRERLPKEPREGKGSW